MISLSIPANGKLNDILTGISDIENPSRMMASLMSKAVAVSEAWADLKSVPLGKRRVTD